MTHLIIATADISRVNIDRFTPLVPEDYRFFVFGQPGVAPYRLLAYLSTLFTDQTLVEVGVHNGWGSMVMGHNGANRVVGYDVDLTTLDRGIQRDNPNLTFKQGLAHEVDPELLLSSPLIHLDALHDGIYERTLLGFLTYRGYNGWVLLDDIRLNGAMRDLWASIGQPKVDLTQWGHDTGTGLVCMGATSAAII